jgi:hypothetical protein
MGTYRLFFSVFWAGGAGPLVHIPEKKPLAEGAVVSGKNGLAAPKNEKTKELPIRMIAAFVRFRCKHSMSFDVSFSTYRGSV